MIIPIMLQSVSIGIFTTGHFYSDFKSVSIQVIIILHTTSNIVPFCTIGDTCNRELWNKFFKIWKSKFWKLIAKENIPYIQIWPDFYIPLRHRSKSPGRLLNVLFTFNFYLSLGGRLYALPSLWCLPLSLWATEWRRVMRGGVQKILYGSHDFYIGEIYIGVYYRVCYQIGTQTRASKYIKALIMVKILEKLFPRSINDLFLLSQLVGNMAKGRISKRR